MRPIGAGAPGRESARGETGRRRPGPRCHLSTNGRFRAKPCPFKTELRAFVAELRAFMTEGQFLGLHSLRKGANRTPPMRRTARPGSR